MNPLVTVAIAAYNVEKFLPQGVDCIRQQTYENLEIILVDDGSTDSTPGLCDRLAEADSRITVVHKENGGLGSARNVGIDRARGEFLYFFDVDDSLEPDFIADSVRMAEEKQADLILYGYYARISTEEQEELISVTEREIHDNAALKRAYCEELLWLKHGNGFAWNKFYRLSFLRKYGFHFGNQRIQQDEPFNMQLYPKLEHVYVCPRAYYHYVIYTSGNAGSRYLPNKADIITDVYHRFMAFYREWQLDDPRVLGYIQNRYLSGIFGVVTGTFFHKDCPWTRAEKRKKIDEILHRPELCAVLKAVPPHYGSNPVNNLQTWAFRHGKAGVLVGATELKIKLKRIIRG